MSNPFDVLEARLSNIENLLLDIKHPAKNPEPVPDRITLLEACELTNQSKSQVYKLTMLNEIPFQKYGKRLVFSRKNLLAWMEKRTISAPTAGDVMENRLAKSAKKHLQK